MLVGGISGYGGAPVGMERMREENLRVLRIQSITNTTLHPPGLITCKSIAIEKIIDII